MLMGSGVLAATGGGAAVGICPTIAVGTLPCGIDVNVGSDVGKFAVPTGVRVGGTVLVGVSPALSVGSGAAVSVQLAAKINTKNNATMRNNCLKVIIVDEFMQSPFQSRGLRIISVL